MMREFDFHSVHVEKEDAQTILMAGATEPYFLDEYFDQTEPIYCRRDMSDELLELLINQISGSIESQLGRKLALGRYQERRAADGTQFLVLHEYPITQVYSVTQNGAVLDPASYDSDLQGDIGVLYKDDGWMYDGYPAGLAGDYVMPSRRIVVDYEAGYVLPPVATEDEPSTLPGDLERLACEMLQDLMEIIEKVKG